MILSYTLAFGAPVGGVPIGMLPYCLVWNNSNGVTIWSWKKFDDIFSYFDRILACDRRMDRHTNRNLV